MTEITIKNFQSIKEASLNIEGFTVIIGRNNIGKSAIVRAIGSALSNQTGSDFIRRGEKSTEVEIKRDGLDLQWKKGSSSSYKINGEAFSKLNRAVPAPVLSHGFRKIDAVSPPLDPLIADQFNPLFLLDKSGTSIPTEVLSALYQLDVLNRADEACQKDLRSNKSLLKTREEDIKKYEESLKPYSDFLSLKGKISRVKDLRDDIMRLSAEIEELDELIEEYNDVTMTLKKYEGREKVVIPEISKIDGLIADFESFNQLYTEIKTAAEKVKKLRDNVIEIPDMGAELRKIETLIEDVKDIRVLADELSVSITSTKETKIQMEAIQSGLESNKKEFSEFEVCPSCERPL